MNRVVPFVAVAMLTLFLSACGEDVPQYAGIDPVLPGSDQFDQQWYDGIHDYSKNLYHRINKTHCHKIDITFSHNPTHHI